ncbi:MAG: hypothetical protein HC889_08065 [Synechococcaceae cyanobacterium SM1_2_3]|nr:hypothetical protein [Synechococcaceae cyanobacterium SM1_2_3]
MRKTLKQMDHLPVRVSEDMARKLAEEAPQDLAIDGAEREIEIEHPKDAERQKRFFSGKKPIP